MPIEPPVLEKVVDLVLEHAKRMDYSPYQTWLLARGCDPRAPQWEHPAYRACDVFFNCMNRSGLSVPAIRALTGSDITSREILKNGCARNFCSDTGLVIHSPVPMPIRHRYAYTPGVEEVDVIAYCEEMVEKGGPPAALNLARPVGIVLPYSYPGLDRFSLPEELEDFLIDFLEQEVAPPDIDFKMPNNVQQPCPLCAAREAEVDVRGWFDNYYAECTCCRGSNEVYYFTQTFSIASKGELQAAADGSVPPAFVMGGAIWSTMRRRTASS